MSVLRWQASEGSSLRSSLSNRVSLTVTIPHCSSGFPAGSEIFTQEYFSCPEQ